MTLRKSALSSFRALRPVIFLVGFGIVSVRATGFLIVTSVSENVPWIAGTVLERVGQASVLLLVLPLAVSIYGPVADRADGVVPTLRRSWRAVRDWYWPVLVAGLTAAFVATVVGVVAVTAWTAIGTVARYLHYTGGDSSIPGIWRFSSELVVVFVGSFAAVFLLTRFADLFVAFEDESPARAWRASLAFARRKPVSFFGYATVIAVLLGTPRVLGIALESFRLLERYGISLVAVIVVETVGLVLASAIHVEYFRTTVEPTAVRQTVPDVPWRRIALVSIVLVSTAAGAGYVRSADLGSGQQPINQLPDDSRAAYLTAVNNTERANHRSTLLQRNNSEQGSEFTVYWRGAIDYDDRQAYSYFYDDDSNRRTGGYDSEGTLANPNWSISGRDSNPFVRQSGNWTVKAVPIYGVVARSFTGTIPRSAAYGNITAVNDSTIRYRIDDPEAVRAALGSGTYRAMNGDLTRESYLSVTVDRRRNVVDRMSFRLQNDDGVDVSYVRRYEEVGTADVHRPEEIGPRSPMEWFWDVLYY